MEDWTPVVVVNVPHMLETQEEYNTRISNSKDKSNRSRANIVKWGNSIVFNSEGFKHEKYSAVLATTP